MWIWANTPSSKSSKLLFPVIKAIKIKNKISGDFQSKNTFDHKIRQKPPPRTSILFASLEKVHGRTSYCHLYFDIINIQQTQQVRTENWNASARRLLPTLRPSSSAAVSLLHQDYVWISARKWFYFHKNEFDAMPCTIRNCIYLKICVRSTLPHWWLFWLLVK